MRKNSALESHCSRQSYALELKRKTLGPQLRLCLPFLIVLGTLLGIGCEDPDGEATFVIEPYRASCPDLAPKLCLLIRRSESGGVEFFYNSISGLQYEWGYRVTARVSWKEISNPPADGSSRAYRLDQVLSREPVDPGYSFRLTLPPQLVGEYNPGIGAGQIGTSGPFFMVPSGASRDSMNAWWSSGAGLGTLQLEFQESPTDTLWVLAADPPGGP